jgi:hypothetical protein
MTSQLDLRTIHPSLYRVGAKTPALITVPDLTMIAIDGVGDPAISEEYQASIRALMTMAWGIRAHRKALDPSSVIRVMPLEGVWTLPGIMFSETPEVRAQLQWSMQIAQPDDVTPEELETVRDMARRKKPGLTRLGGVRLERIAGGPAATMLHRGPFSEEPATIARIHEAIEASGGEPVWGHREIYLSDLHRAKPENLKTILRVDIRR